MKALNATDAKNNFGALLEALSQEPVEIVKNGKPVAVVVSAKDFEQMKVSFALDQAKARVRSRDPDTLRTLERFSRGELQRSYAVKKLGLYHYTQLLDLLGAARLPLPTLPDKVIDQMIEDLFGALDEQKEKVT